MISIWRKTRYISGILFFPVAQVIFFVTGLALIGPHRGAALLCFFLASLALCFSVHVTFHEAVHQKWCHGRSMSWIADSIMTLLMGLSLDGYRWHHFNHHRYNNTLDDYSCTWKQTRNGIIPQTPWVYMLGWPAQVQRSQERMNQEEAKGILPKALSWRMTVQKNLTFLFVTALALFSWKIALCYVVCIYIGWAFVALENYAQHPPIEYGVDTTTSYYDAFYNLIFCKNGFHSEHHRTASLPWIDLSRVDGSRSIRIPYLFESLFSTGKRKSDK